MHTLMGAYFVVVSMTGVGGLTPWGVIGPYHSEKECMAYRLDLAAHDRTGILRYDCAAGDGPAGTSYWKK